MTKKKAASAAPATNTKQMVINYTPGEECRVAMVEHGRLEEFHSERANAVSFVGNIYVGRVVNVEAAIQAAFIDFGLGANGFLHVSDLHPQYFPGEDEETREQIGRKTPRRERPPIQQCLKRGQEVIVQVLKEGISTKGPTLTSYLSIPGRYLVMLPQMDRVGVSRKVEDEDQRREMRKILDGLDLPPEFGFILRTAGMGKSKIELKRDLAYLLRLWKDIEKRQNTGQGPRLLYAESDLLMRALRDYWTSDVDEIIIDHEGAARRTAQFMRIVSPRSSTQLVYYDRPAPVFHAFGIEQQIGLMLERTVPLPSGGSLVIDETEALVAIDVNSGKMRSHGDAETTAYRTNVEAVDEICRQIRLRDVGGLVLCDFIDMVKRSNRRDIEGQLRERLKRDRAATKPLPISDFGIVEMTRQRMRGSLRSVHFARCPACEGRGVLRKPDSTAGNALRELGALLAREKVAKVEMVVSPRLSGELLSNRRNTLSRLEARFGKHVSVRVSEDIGEDRVNFYAYESNGNDIALDQLPALRPPTDLAVWIEKADVGADWSVDSAAEHEVETLIPEFDDSGSEAHGLPAFLDEEGDLESLEPARSRARPEGSGGADEPGEKRGRRRRRRGGRGRRSGEAGPDDRGPAPSASGAPQSRPDRAPAPRAQNGDDDEDTSMMVAESSDGYDSSGGRGEGDAPDGEGGPRRRRRRRRRGRGRGGADREGDGADAPVASDNGEAPRPAPAPRAPAPRTGGQSRGDSWDLAPSEIVLPAIKHVPQAEPLDAKPSRKPAPAAPMVEADEPDDGPGDAPAGEAEGGDAPKARRRRGGRSRGRSGDRKEPRAESGSAPAPAPVRAAPADPKPKASDAKPDTKPAAKPALKPVRSLYATQRKKPAPGAAASRSRDE
jgi:ribonuclease E